MNITADIFEAFLKCPTKCYLRSVAEARTGNPYADRLRTQKESCRSEGIKRLTEGAKTGECVIGSSGTNNFKSAKWRLATEYVVRVQNLESSLHAVERVPSEGRGQHAQFIPIRFTFANKLYRDDKLLVAFDALVLSERLGHAVGRGKITTERIELRRLRPPLWRMRCRR